MRYTALYWYRHESDTDQSLRAMCQMSARAAGEADVRAEVASLQAQDYLVQRVVLQLDCPSCTGAGRIGKRMKGARKDSHGHYMQVYRTCAVCQGDGWTEGAEVTL